MGADNGGVCPRCNARAVKERNRLLEVPQSDYGDIPKALYLKVRAEIEKPLVLEYHLREDYELYVNTEGIFLLWYSCQCSTCDFSFSYKHEEKVPV